MGVKISELTEAMAAQNTDEMPIVQNGETKKINVETLMSNLQTQITNLQNQVNDKNIMTAYLSQNQVISTTTSTKVTLNTVKEQTGSKLTLQNNSIVIGAGINHILVTGQLMISAHTTDGLRRMYIYKNSTQVARSLKNISANYETLNISSFLIPVAENDTISLYSDNATGSTTINGSSNDTYLTVEAID